MEWNLCSADMRTNITKFEKYIQCVYMPIAFSYTSGKPLPQAIHPPLSPADILREVA